MSVGRTRVKICCIGSEAEARTAIETGADALGLVAEMPSGPGTISDDRIEAIARGVPPGVDSFLLTSRTAPDAVVEHVLGCRTSVVQLVRAVDPEVYAALRARAPNVRIVQVVHVEGEASLAEARRVGGSVDAVLLDSGRPSASEFGGTGRVHDWAVSAAIVEALDVPVYLAGGLRAENVGEAIRQVRPYGLDLCSGVRTDGALDAVKLQAFMQAVAEAA